MIHTYKITGMHCQNCTAKVTHALEAVPDVATATVTLDPPEARVEMTKHVPTGRLQEAIKEAGDYSLQEREAEPVARSAALPAPSETPQSLAPLFIIIAYILSGVILRAALSNNFSWPSLMENFMGGFFVVFSLFKMINLPGFADAYSTYDILARRSRVYAFAYPFIELSLGVAYFAGFAPRITNLLTVVLMSVGAIGVLRALLQKRAIQCACLGTALSLPMTKVTLVEDVVMGLMALGMLYVSPA